MSSITKVPAAWDRQQRRSEESYPFCFTIKSIENVPRSVLRLKDDYPVKVCIQTCLFDQFYKQFFGRCCRGSVKSSEKLSVNFDEDIHFYICYDDVNIILAVELIQISKNEEICLGWTTVQLFNQTDGDLNNVSGNFTSPLFYGSSLSLLFADTSLNYGSHGQKILNCQIEFSLHFSRSLIFLLHLIPENTLVAQKETICGFKNPRDNSSTLKGVRKLKKIPPIACIDCTINDVVIHFDTTIEQFENLFCQRFSSDNYQNVIDNVNILERRLQVGIHNGWNFIEEPHIYHLVLDLKEVIGNSGDKRKWSFRSKKSQNLVLRNKIHLTKIPSDQHIKIIFIIDYVISVTSNSITKNLNVNIFCAMWSPFPEMLTSHLSDIKTQLNVTNETDLRNLCQVMCFNGIEGSNENCYVNFKFHVDKKQSSKTKTTTITNSKRSSYSDEISSSLQIPETKNVGSHQLQEENSGSSTEKSVIGTNPLIIDSISTPVAKKLPVDVTRALNLHFFDEKIFIPIQNRWNQSAIIVDPRDPVEIDYFVEEKDFLRTNEIVFQFMAISWTNTRWIPKSVKICFQFYKLKPCCTGRLDLIYNEVFSNFFTLRSKVEKNPLSSNLETCQVKYLIDPNLWPSNFHKEFISYLTKCEVQFDIFEADSLIYLGSCTTLLNKLFRRGNEAVQVLQQMEIILNVDPPIARNVVQVPQSRTEGSVTRGLLYVRMGNVGHPTDAISRYTLTPHVVKSQIGTSEIKSEDYHAPHYVTKARSLINVKCKRDQEKLRKLKRMELVRLSHQERIQNSDLHDQMLIQLKRVKIMRAWQEKNKHNCISKLLRDLIVVQHSLNLSVGSTAFFEYEIFNPSTEPITVFIDIEESDLKIVTSASEWRFYKQLEHLSGEVEENICCFDSKTNFYQIFLHGKEKIKIPFKYQPYSWNFKNHLESTLNDANVPEVIKKQFKVNFFKNNLSILSTLSLDVNLFFPVVTQRFIFFQEARMMFERIIRIPSVEINPDDVSAGNSKHEVYFCRSDSKVSVEITRDEVELTNNLILKMQCGEPLTRNQFFVYLFSNPFLIRPIQTWHVTVVTAYRHDISCALGQTHTCPLLLRGENVERRVRCWSSNLDIVDVEPKEYFLHPRESHHLQLKVKPNALGYSSYFVNVTDVNDSTIVSCWIICVNCHLPVTGRHFLVELAYNKITNKKLSFTNNKPEPHIFYLRSNNPETMSIKETKVRLNPGEKWLITVQFRPVITPGPSEILLFIDSDEGVNQEIISIHIKYLTNN